MHVTPFSAADLVFAIASPLNAQGSHGSGPAGFARRSNTMCGTVSASKSMCLVIPIIPTRARGVLPIGRLHCRNCLRHRPDVSGYRPRVVCDRRSRVEDPARQAPAPFAETLVGIVCTRSTFMINGSDVQYTNPFTGGVLLFTSGGFPRIEASIR